MLKPCSSFKFNSNTQVATLKNSLIDLSLIDRQDVMNSILHCSDISGPGKMWNIHETWTLLLMQEFFAQVSVTVTSSWSVVKLNLKFKMTHNPSVLGHNRIEQGIAPFACIDREL